MATRAWQRQLTLPPAPESARQARRFVTEVLSDVRLESDVLDVATLLTSELVTNGIVHAHTEMRVIVEVTDAWVRIEVDDGNPLLPARRDYDTAAMTGRGMEMVELLAAEFGAEPIDNVGKRVWFRLRRGDATGTATPGGPVLTGAAGTASAGRRTVTLTGLPVALYCAWQQHADALLREATLVALDDCGQAPADFALAAQALGAVAVAAGDIFTMRDDGVTTADVPLRVRADALAWFPILRDVLARATAMSRNGQLLTPASLPEIVALRNWVCEEMSRQAAGLPPQRWIPLSTDDTAPSPAASPATLSAVRDSALALVAADASNRIVAISPAAAELLGWEPADLEGRRLVTIIPAGYRDRHVAGFTRHLLDGSSRILDRPVHVPALRRDGTEVLVTMRIERRPDPATRALFVATFSVE